MEQNGGDASKPAPADATRQHVDRVGVRVPPFYPEMPALWFSQLESQFALAGITTDSTRYHYAVGHLDPVHAAEIEDIITAPPASNKYEILKAELIKRLSASRERKVRQLLTHEELGDRKPSQFLRHLRHLAGPGVPEEFLKTIWIGRLPTATQSIIASQSKAPLEEVAELADRLLDIVPSQPHVAMTSAADNQIAELTRQVASLAATVQRMSRAETRRAPGRRGDSRPRSRSASNYRKFPLCWYHSKYGSDAAKCVKPCDFAGGKAPGSA